MQFGNMFTSDSPSTLCPRSLGPFYNRTLQLCIAGVLPVCPRDVYEVPLPGRPQVEREHGPVRLGDQRRLQPQLRARLRRGPSLQILQILILQSQCGQLYR